MVDESLREAQTLGGPIYNVKHLDGEVHFYVPNYTETMFDNYIDNVKKNALYDTGVDINYNDKLLTLQTCVEYRSDEREIVLLKEIERKEYR